jgi:hypothetical protein
VTEVSTLKQARLTPISTLTDRGELRPQSVREVPSVARPAQLDDLDWLRDRYRTSGYRSIAKELGVSVGTVRRACTRLGIKPAGDGRRRGATLIVLPVVTVPIHERVLARYQHERSLTDGPAPSVQLAITRARDTVLAFHDGDPALIAEALEALAVSAMLALDHEQQRRATA